MALGNQFINNSCGFGHILPYQGLSTAYGSIYGFENDGVSYEPRKKLAAFLAA
jgi:hypothetical protein